MKKLGLIYSYYQNLMMFRRQLDEWSNYLNTTKNQISICVVDDCSLVPINISFEITGLDISIFRIEKKMDWNWLACRNIGAKELDTEWLLLTDMDHLLNKDNIETLLSLLDVTDPKYVYFLRRQYACNGFPIGSHTNTYLMTKEMYWKIGGYNEAMSGAYYGTTGEFQKRVFIKSKGIKTLNDVCLSLFCKEDITDAVTISLTKLTFNGNLEPFKVLSFPYKKLK